MPLPLQAPTLLGQDARPQHVGEGGGDEDGGEALLGGGSAAGQRQTGSEGMCRAAHRMTWRVLHFTATPRGTAPPPLQPPTDPRPSQHDVGPGDGDGGIEQEDAGREKHHAAPLAQLRLPDRLLQQHGRGRGIAGTGVHAGTQQAGSGVVAGRTRMAWLSSVTPSPLAPKCMTLNSARCWEAHGSWGLPSAQSSRGVGAASKGRRRFHSSDRRRRWQLAASTCRPAGHSPCTPASCQSYRLPCGSPSGMVGRVRAEGWCVAPAAAVPPPGGLADPAAWPWLPRLAGAAVSPAAACALC